MIKKIININMLIVIFLFAKNEILCISDVNLKKYIKNSKLRFLIAVAIYGYKLIYMPFFLLLSFVSFNPMYATVLSIFSFYLVFTSEKQKYKLIWSYSLLKNKIKLYVFFKMLPLVFVMLLICYYKFNYMTIIVTILFIFFSFLNIKIFKKMNLGIRKNMNFLWYVLTVLLLTLFNYLWIFMIIVPVLFERVLVKKSFNYKLENFLITVVTLMLQMILYFNLIDLEIIEIIFTYIDFENEFVRSLLLNTSKLIIPFFLIFRYYISLTDYSIVCSEDVRVYFHRCFNNELIKFNQKDKLKYYLVDVFLLAIILINMIGFGVLSVINLIFCICQLKIDPFTSLKLTPLDIYFFS